MIECNKCKDWYHNTCLNLSESEINEILIFFCPECKAANPSHKIVRKDYSKEHTKPLFKKYGILSVLTTLLLWLEFHYRMLGFLEKVLTDFALHGLPW